MQMNVETKLKNNIGELAFNKSDLNTIDEVADQLGLAVMHTRKLLATAIKKKFIQKLQKRDGQRIMYPQQMVTQLKSVYDSGKLGTPRRRNKVTVPADAIKMMVQVPVLDEVQAKILLQKFGSEEGVVKFLKDKLAEFAAPIQSQLQALDESYNAQRNKILNTTTSQNH